MRFAYGSEGRQSQDTLTQFLGLNKTFSLKDGEFSAMQNMSGDHYPVLSSRQKRLRCRAFTDCRGVYAKNELLWVDGTVLQHSTGDIGTVSIDEKTFVGMGAYVLIFPDALAYNTVQNTLTSLGATFSTKYGDSPVEVPVLLCNAEGTKFDYQELDTAPENPENGAYWMDTSDTVNSLKRYNSSTKAWASVVGIYTKLICTGIGTQFKAYDTITITGATDDALNGNMVIESCGADYIVVPVSLQDGYTQKAELVVKRIVPNLKYVTECNNRVWGCNNETHEIYACRLGDPYNWFDYTGEADDSYAVTVGTDGDFTGAATVGGYPVFFKENAIHKVYGTKPSDFGMQTIAARGVQAGSAKSIATVNETLFYKAVDGIMYYDGSTPAPASEALGTALYTDAVGGARGNKYYVSMKDVGGGSHLFVLDTKTGIWYEEDDTQAQLFITCKNDVFFVADNVLWALTDSSVAEGFHPTAEDDPLIWYATTGEMHWLEPDRKFVSKLQIRVDLEPDATLKIKLAYDGGTPETVLLLTAQASKKAYNIPIIPRRCDHFNITIAGTGTARVYAISRLLERGSDL